MAIFACAWAFAMTATVWAVVPGLSAAPLQHKEVDGRDKPADDCFQRCRNTAV
jgi:hypothetical protein